MRCAFILSAAMVIAVRATVDDAEIERPLSNILKTEDNNKFIFDSGSLSAQQNNSGEQRTFGIFSSGLNLRNNDPDFEKPVEYLVTSKGYPFEKHYATTEDGYIITMHRLPHGRRDKNAKDWGVPNKKVALLGVPLMAESSIWVMDFPNNSFAFILADRGYDVWLTNVRGSTFGKHHTNMSTYDKKFWHFTFVDIGEKDLSAQIDYALKKTGQTQVYYAGLSQGGASMFALLAKRPEYNDKLKAFAALGTFRRTCHINIWFLNAASSLENYLGRLPIIEVMPKISMLDRACDMADKVCVWYTNTFLYTDTKYVNTTRLPVYMNHFPSGTSKMNLFYYSQIMQPHLCTEQGYSDVREYDYDRAAVTRWHHSRVFWNIFGEQKRINPLMYQGRMDPPVMSTENIRAPIKLYWSDGDRWAPPQEQAILKKELGSIVAEYHIADMAFGHYSFCVNAHNASVFIDVADFFDDCAANASYCKPSKKTTTAHHAQRAEGNDIHASLNEHRQQDTEDI